MVRNIAKRAKQLSAGFLGLSVGANVVERVNTAFAGAFQPFASFGPTIGTGLAGKTVLDSLKFLGANGRLPVPMRKSKRIF